MLSIHRLLGSNRNQINVNQRSKSQPKCEERLIPDKNDGLDTVSFSTKNVQSWQEIAEEWREYTSSIWGKPEPEFENREEREKYWITYYDNYIAYCDKLLNCKNLSQDVKSEWENMRNYAKRDRSYHYRDLNNWKKDNGIKTESYKDVKDEMIKNNIPDINLTISEKELLRAYVDRMLSCDDVPLNDKDYLTNKLNILDMNMRSIENGQKVGNGEKFEDVQKEFSEFTQKYWVENIRNDESVYQKSGFEGKHEYLVTVRRTMLTYVDRILACSDIPRDEKEYYQGLKVLFRCDLNSYAAEANYHNQSEGKRTEAFYDVLSEMKQNVPDSTRTVNEKRLAISYIERMLSCDDIPNPEYWQNKLNVIEKELQALENRGTRRR